MFFVCEEISMALVVSSRLSNGLQTFGNSVVEVDKRDPPFVWFCELELDVDNVNVLEDCIRGRPPPPPPLLG